MIYFKSGTIPENATHVRVDCRSDALAASRTIYALADGLQKSLPTLIMCGVLFCCWLIWRYNGYFPIIFGRILRQFMIAGKRDGLGVYVPIGEAKVDDIEQDGQDHVLVMPCCY